MRVKFMQNGISCVIKTTNVHYCDLSDEFEEKYGLSVLQKGMSQNTGILFTGLSEDICNGIVDSLFRNGSVSLEDYDYDDIQYKKKEISFEVSFFYV